MVAVSEMQSRLANLERELHQESERLELLVNSIRNVSLELDVLLNQLLRDLHRVLPQADLGIVFLLEKNAGVLRPHAWYGLAEGALVSKFELLPGEGVSGGVLKTGKPALVKSSEEFRMHVGELRRENAATWEKTVGGFSVISHMAVPLKTPAHDTIGTVALSSTSSAFTEQDLALLEGVGGQIAQAIANAELFSALAASEERYRQLVDYLPIGFAETTTDGRFKYMNRRACEIIGYEPEELATLKAEDVWAEPASRGDYLKSLERADVHSVEVQAIRKDGRRIWAQAVSRAVRDADGKLVSIGSTFEDVTEKRRQAARERAIQSVREEVWKMTSEGDIKNVLSAVRRDLATLEIPFRACGINVLDPTSDPPLARSHNMGPRDDWVVSEKRADALHKMWQQGKPAYRRDLHEEDPYDEWPRIGRWVRSVLDVPFSHGTLAVSSPEAAAFSDDDIALIQDLARVLSEGFHRMEDLVRLAEERERLAVTLHSIADGVITCDARGNILGLNGVAEMLIGCTQREAEGRPLTEIYRVLDPDRGGQADSPIDLVAQKKTAVRRAKQLILLGREGEERVIADSTAPIQDREGKILGTVVVFRDVTAQRVREAEQSRSEKLESLGVLAGGIAHDFNNILTTIIGSISLAKLDVRPEEPLYENLTLVEDASRRAAALTQQLLTFSQGGAPVKRLASVGELIADSATFALRGSNVRWELEAQEDLWPAEVDSGQVSQVIQNLVMNADQAMPEGGVVKIAAVNTQVVRGAGLPLPEGPYIKITVADEGMGISPPHLKRIFEPYFTTKQQGSGLGLATVHSIVTNHGGHISVDSRLGRGTKFTFYIPGKADQQVSPYSEEEALLHGAGRILVMDDEAEIRNALGAMLAALGYEATFASEGGQALEGIHRGERAGAPVRGCHRGPDDPRRYGRRRADVSTQRGRPRGAGRRIERLLQRSHHGQCRQLRIQGGHGKAVQYRRPGPHSARRHRVGTAQLPPPAGTIVARRFASA